MAMMATVTPNGNWNVAETATVEFDSTKYENVQIVRVLWTDAKVAARSEKFPNGVVFLNQQELPDSDDPITIPYEETTGEEIEQIELNRSDPWPQGKAALFK